MTTIEAFHVFSSSSSSISLLFLPNPCRENPNLASKHSKRVTERLSNHQAITCFWQKTRISQQLTQFYAKCRACKLFSFYRPLLYVSVNNVLEYCRSTSDNISAEKNCRTWKQIFQTIRKSFCMCCSVQALIHLARKRRI